MEKLQLTRKKLIAIIVVAVLLLSVAVYWYYGEYSVRNDQDAFVVEIISKAFHMPQVASDIYVIETNETERFPREKTILFYDQREGLYGIAHFERGFNRRYRLTAFLIRLEGLQISDIHAGGGFSTMPTNFPVRMALLFFLGAFLILMIWKWPKESEDLEADKNKKFET